MQGLDTVESYFEIWCQRDFFQVDRDDFLTFVKREIDFAIAVVRFERVPGNEEQESISTFQRKSSFCTPVLASRNSLVVLY